MKNYVTSMSDYMKKFGARNHHPYSYTISKSNIHVGEYRPQNNYQKTTKQKNCGIKVAISHFILIALTCILHAYLKK